MRGHKTAFPTVSRLGTLSDGHAVYGAFLDTADYTGFGLGVAGVQGSISRRQARWIAAALKPYTDQYLILLSHHPSSEFSSWSSRRLADIVAPFGDRVLALVSAHTHLAAKRYVAVGGRPLAEIVIGSVIDAPRRGRCWR